MQTNQAEQKQHAIAGDSDFNPKPLEIRRQFEAPVARLFEAFTSAEALKAWWWPNGLHADRIDYDFREGGKFFINMKGKVQGKDFSGGMMGEFQKIVQNERIVMTDTFADENGHAISAREAGMSGEWPENITITFVFEPAGDAASRLHLTQQGIPEEMQKDCVQGWSESFDKLVRYLAGRTS